MAVERFPVWGPDTDEVVHSVGATFSQVTVPAGCTGLAFSVIGTNVIYLTSDSADLNSGMRLPADASKEIGIQGSPTIYLVSTVAGPTVINVVRLYD